MCVLARLLSGVLLVSNLFAQTSSLVTKASSTQDAADVRLQQQLNLEGLIANAQNQANQQKLAYQNEYAALDVQLSKCNADKSIAGIQAQKDADDKKVNAQTNMINTAAGGVGPLVQGAMGWYQAGNEKADKDIKEAVRNYNQLNGTPVPVSGTSSSTSHNGSSNSATNSASSTNIPPVDPTGGLGCKTIQMSADGSNASAVISSANSRIMQNMNGMPGANQACLVRMNQLKNLAEEARETIRSAKSEKEKLEQSRAQTIAGASQLGLALYGNNVAKKGSESGLSSAKEMGQIYYDTCVQGINNQKEELQRKMDALNAQLASDIDRLRKQFAAQRVEISPNSSGLPVAEDTSIDTSELNGGGIPPSNLKSSNPFANKNKGNSSAAGAAGGGAPGGNASGSDGKLGWGFGNPSDNVNPGLYQGLPTQPGSASVSGGGEVGGGGLGENPFGDPMMPGAEDAFANVGAGGPAKLASFGNGFLELAMRTHRRVYAHLGELLGGTGSSSGPQITNKENTSPERKITSTKN